MTARLALHGNETCVGCVVGLRGGGRVGWVSGTVLHGGMTWRQLACQGEEV